MSRYLLAPAAQADLVHIGDYTADRWDADQAEGYLRELQRYRARRGEPAYRPGLR